MIISVDSETVFDKIQYPLTIKTQQIKNRRKHPQREKGHLQKTTANIKINDEEMNAFLLKTGTNQGCSLSSL